MSKGVRVMALKGHNGAPPSLPPPTQHRAQHKIPRPLAAQMARPAMNPPKHRDPEGLQPIALPEPLGPSLNLAPKGLEGLVGFPSDPKTKTNNLPLEPDANIKNKL